ncbi:Signal transduction histidine kinase [Acetoanaerobium noterae]|uniref:histidine kinase n=3 Tax=Acetoanaerobium noterae TaxID=745369 RepID=A0A1T5CIV7_9FIRM|nr:Signal transduction histidine kinase [Acetoanaerobium noterae]
MYTFTSQKQLMYSAIIFIVILFLSLTSYNYFINRIYLNDLLSVMSNIANGRYEKKSLDENKHTEMDTQLNMISARVETLEKQKDSFIYDISHELRTPLSTIKILSQSIQYSQNDEVDIYKEFFSDIVNEIDRMDNIITDMMQSVDLDPNSYIVKLRLSYLNYLCESIVKRLQPIAFKKNITIEFVALSNLQIYIDPTKIDRAVSNIIENAIKYSENDSKIEVTLYQERNRACISVRDEGIGISQSEINRIFERFYRVKKDRSRTTGGSGLGLYITKKIIDMHQGEIDIKSIENIGSIFTIKLPMNLYSQTIFNKNS